MPVPLAPVLPWLLDPSSQDLSLGVVLDNWILFFPGLETAAQTLSCPSRCCHCIPAPGLGLSMGVLPSHRCRVFLLVTFSGQGAGVLSP